MHQLSFQATDALSPLFMVFAGSRLLHLAQSFGQVGLFLISIVDSSFVPLPIPGITDVMIVLFAAQHANVITLVLIATAGSALGGLFSHMVAQAGGMAFLEQHVPARILKPVSAWMQSHALIAIALPALLPPPMPLAPFVLAAGALHMDRKRFLVAFTLSRLARHAIAAWLGIHYGRGILHLWALFSARWGEPVLIGIWTLIFFFAGYAFFKLYRTSRRVGVRISPSRARTPGSDPA